jgi:hypothetical protein
MANGIQTFFFGGYSLVKFRFSPVMNHTKPLSYEDQKMKAVIIYEDVASAKRAITILQRASLPARVQWEFKPWRADMLGSIAAAGEALKEAVDAEVIVLEDFPDHRRRPWLLNWLQCWSVIRESRKSALVLIRATSNSEISQQLFTFAEQNHVDLIVEESSSAVPLPMGPVLVEAGGELPTASASQEVLALQPGAPQNAYRA